MISLSFFICRWEKDSCVIV